MRRYHDTKMQLRCSTHSTLLVCCRSCAQQVHNRPHLHLHHRAVAPALPLPLPLPLPLAPTTTHRRRRAGASGLRTICPNTLGSCARTRRASLRALSLPSSNALRMRYDSSTRLVRTCTLERALPLQIRVKLGTRESVPLL